MTPCDIFGLNACDIGAKGSKWRLEEQLEKVQKIFNSYLEVGVTAIARLTAHFIIKI